MLLKNLTTSEIEAQSLARIQETLLSRKQLSRRWGVSLETLKRRQREGTLPALIFNRRLIRYRLRDIEEFERAAASGKPPLNKHVFKPTAVPPRAKSSAPKVGFGK